MPNYLLIYAHKIFPQFPNAPMELPLDTFFRPTPSLKGMMTYLYSHIYSLRLTSLGLIKELWETELGEEIPGDIWEVALKRVHKSSICARHSLVQCKILHRAHLTKVRLSETYKDVDPACDRCTYVTRHQQIISTCSGLVQLYSLSGKTFLDHYPRSQIKQ